MYKTWAHSTGARERRLFSYNGPAPAPKAPSPKPPKIPIVMQPDTGQLCFPPSLGRVYYQLLSERLEPGCSTECPALAVVAVQLSPCCDCCRLQLHVAAPEVRRQQCGHVLHGLCQPHHPPQQAHREHRRLCGVPGAVRQGGQVPSLDACGRSVSPAPAALACHLQSNLSSCTDAQHVCVSHSCLPCYCYLLADCCSLCVQAVTSTLPTTAISCTT